MKYKGEINNLKNWNKDMAKKDKLTDYKCNFIYKSISIITYFFKREVTIYLITAI